ncbi:uncharacterized protein MONOS_16928 [Monocercomonoides exilis]|uniref:uncharacterized protein n=1 Tax=Monocercomonoides exilis TaxID=2049356 RepID=UPI003559B46C|nr:hypothetical protein MONOS_16928 [Monocercomonoides exilis]
MLFLGDDSSPKSEIQYELLLKCIPIYGDQTVGPYVLLIGSFIGFVLIDTFYAVSAVLIFCAMFNIMRKTIPRMKFVPGIEIEDFISKPEEKEKCIPANRNNKSTCAAVLNRKSAFRFVTTVLPMLVFLVSFFIIYITQSSKKKRPRSSAASNSSKSGSSSSRSLQKTIPNSSQNSMHRTRIQSMQDEPMLLGLQEGNGDLSQSLHNPSLYFTGQSLSSSSSNDLYRSLSFESDLPHNPISEADQTISDSTKTTQRGSLDLSFLESGKTTVKKKKKKKKKNTSL